MVTFLIIIIGLLAIGCICLGIAITQMERRMKRLQDCISYYKAKEGMNLGMYDYE